MGEVSRFLYQLEYHYGIKVKMKSISFDIGFGNAKAIEVKKTPLVMEKLLQFASDKELSPSLSASSINSYIDCPLQFYLTKVEVVEQSDEVQETVEANMFGSIFHKVMENLYAPFIGKLMLSEDFELMEKNINLIGKEIQRAFNSEYFKRKTGELIPLEGNNLLIASVLRKYILQVIKLDKRHAPFIYVSSEERCTIKFPIQNGDLKVNIKGFIDRVDEKEGRLRILDYKTGTGKLEFKNLEEVFEHNKENRPKFVLQTFLYGILYKNQAKGKQITPGIYYIRDIFKDDFEAELNNKELNEKVSDFSKYETDFQAHLRDCLQEIFNSEIPFSQTTNKKVCLYCPYIGICNK